MKKTLALLLALLMTASAMTACSEQGENNTDSPTPAQTSASPTAGESADTEPEETVDPRQAISDDLPEKDFGGRDFIVLGSDDQHFGNYVYVEEIVGETVNDAVFSRNLAIEERFGAKVKRYAPSNSYGDTTNAIKQAVQAGDSETFHLVSYHVVAAGGAAMAGNFINWYELDHINFDKPWWSDSTVEDLSINNHCYLAVGDAAVSSISQTYCVIYDKDTAQNYDIGNVYETVRNGQWTVDKLKSIAAVAAKDKDGNGIWDGNDYYGFTTNKLSNVNAYLWAFGNKILTPNADGTADFTYYDEHLVDIFEATFSLCNETEGVYAPHSGGTDHYSAINHFANYGALFTNALLSYTTSFLTDYENEYGIIPYPKYDEAQAEYITMVDGNHEAMAIAKNAQDFEFIGIITEALCAEAYKQILPAYYDLCLKSRYASSPEDAEMIELCVNSRVFDMGYVYDNWKGASFYFQDLIATNNRDIASYFKTRKKIVNRYYDSVIELFTVEEE